RVLRRNGFVTDKTSCRRSATSGVWSSELSGSRGRVTVLAVAGRPSLGSGKRGSHRRSRGRVVGTHKPTVGACGTGSRSARRPPSAIVLRGTRHGAPRSGGHTDSSAGRRTPGTGCRPSRVLPRGVSRFSG